MSRRRVSVRSPGRGEEEVKPSYSAVYVLLLSWEHDDLGVISEINHLAVTFEKAYGFQVERYLIPSVKPDDAFEQTLKTFVRRYESPRSLLIVYYGGHGMLNASRLGIWACNSQPDHPELRWYSHQRHLEDSDADILLLLDCCQPLGGGGSVRRATGKQVLAACGFGCDAPGVGEDSFSQALNEELLKAATKPFSVSELHHRILNNLRSVVPDHYREKRQTPVLSILGEGGIPSPSIRLVSYATHPVNLIALMGGTGSGKSSLINRICGKDVALVGDSQASLTKEVTHYTAVVNGETITLIDTPGFDDTYLSDRQVLERISTYLYKHYQRGRKLSGLLFLREINLSRMTGSALKNLDMFHRLCGEESLKNVVLVTTKWDKAPANAYSHEQELVKDFWAEMIKLGSSRPKRLGKWVDPSSGIVDPGSEVIAPMLQFQPTYLQIQRELGNGKDLIETAAGQYIDRDLSFTIEKLEESYASALAEAEKTGRLQLKEALTDQAAVSEEGLEGAQNDKKALREDFVDVMKAEEERRSNLFGYSTLSRLDEYVTELEGKGSYVRLYTIGVSSVGLFEACKYLWRKQGKSQDLIQSAHDSMENLGFFHVDS